MAYVVKIFSLEKYLDKRAEILSGGNKRKLCAALSIIASPSLLFMDEPSTGLDPVSRIKFQKAIKVIGLKNDSSVLITTHRMDEAEGVCDKIMIMVNG